MGRTARLHRKVRSPGTAPKRALPPALERNLWKPGQSGNPSGQSGAYGEVVALARTLSVRAIERLGELIESDDARVTTVACQAILDRAHGKPRAEVSDDAVIDAYANEIDQMAPEERQAYIVELFKEVLKDWGWVVIKADAAE